MNPANLTAIHFRAFLLSLGFVVASATAQTSETPAAKPAPSAKEEAVASEEDDSNTTKLIKLESVEVLGTHIRRTDIEGPSPVSTYDADYIRSTGANTVADFINELPQAYAGIAAGRSSAPNELNPEFGQRTESSFPAFNFILGASAAPPGQTGVSGVSLRGLGSGSTLVLIDGRRVAQSGAGNRSTDTRQGFVDLNTIPLGMVERIELITDGASAIYGADAVAGVVNIVLKKNWQGNELSAAYKAAEHGGGHERNISLLSGFTTGKLQGNVALSYFDRAPLKASQRAFSRNQDHSGVIAGYNADGTPVYGRDLRIIWGYPAVVQARTGTLNYITEAGGNQTRFATVNPGTTGPVTINDFTAVGPGRTNGGSYIRYGNTAEFLDLVPSAERLGVNANFTYTISDRLSAFAGYSYSDNKALANTQPPVSSAAASSGFGNVATIVPAALNPFNQDVLVGLVHYEFGAIWKAVTTESQRAHAGLRGSFGDTWQWESAISIDKQEHGEITRDFNASGITAVLANGSLNPFLDARAAGNTNAATYETLALYPYLDSNSETVFWDFRADGDLFTLPGGELKMAWGADFQRGKVDSESLRYSTGFSGLISTTSTTAAEGDNYGVFTEFLVPIFGQPNRRNGLHRLDLTVAARYADYDYAESVVVPKVGLSWAPAKSFLLRTGYSEGFRPPGLTELTTTPAASTTSVTDPRRTPANTTGVQVTSGSNPNADPEISTTVFYGLVFEPENLPGLSFQVNYYDTRQEDTLQQLSANTIVLNEAIFADRITRAPADANDIALNQPGRLLTVNRTFVSFGEIVNRSVDFAVDYKLPWKEFGTWSINLTSVRALENSVKLAPGQPEIDLGEDTGAPPTWRHRLAVNWRKDGWGANLFYTYMDGFETNSAGNTFATHRIDSVDKFDLFFSYRFTNGIWRGYGKDVRVGLGIDNVLDTEPPFSDTVWGYNGGLHSQWVMGRSYEFSVVVPF